ncbi:MAG: adenylate/guanylate cyclase domain-containing protein [Nitrososphaera sp.]
MTRYSDSNLHLYGDDRGSAHGAVTSLPGGDALSQYRRESDSEQHESKERQQIEILLRFFDDSRKYCVCMVDMVSSTAISRSLGDSGVGRYYSIFLNRMANIATNFGAVVVKNIGDSILYYFPETELGTPASFKNVLLCGIAMLEEREPLNRKMRNEGLPEVSYRVSCEYGSVAVAKVSTSSVNDIFGTTVNHCSRINDFAPRDSMVIGQGMYEKVRSLDSFAFAESLLPTSSAEEGLYRMYIVRRT